MQQGSILVRAMWCVVAMHSGLALPAAVTAESLDRGVVAMPVRGGVYIGWRLLAGDPKDVCFHVYRTDAGTDAPKRLTVEPVRRSTNFVDSSPGQGSRYFVRAVTGDEEGTPSPSVPVAGGPADASYIQVAFQGPYAAQKAALGDLDGDGALEIVIKQPNYNVDPFQRPGYWKRSTDTFKLEAYRLDGKMLWRRDLGWAIEEGIWYSPYVVYDLDGDGRAEVYTKGGEGDPRDARGLVNSGPEWLLQIDGATGEVKRKLPWPDRSGYEDYNWASRHLLGIAYLDGKRPHLIVERGTYSQIKVEAYDPQLNLAWRWNSGDEKERYRGCGTHGMHAADVDGDGRDEIILGSAVLDDNGHGLWTRSMHNRVMAHPDVCYVGDIDPAHPGLEIFYGFETGQPRDGVCLVDAKTGGMLWSFDGPTSHVHNQGMVADILGEYPGQECYAAEKDGSQYWLYSAKGERIGKDKIDGLSPRAAHWDADPQKEIVVDKVLRRYKGREYRKIEGDIVNIADCIGDWREEIITSLPGELRIYTTTLPADSRRVCPMQDRLYRLDVAVASMGYFYPAQQSAP